MPRDLHLLPRMEDRWSFLYVEHCRIEQEGKSISVYEASGRTLVPCAVLSMLMLGPGSSITHAAVRALAESGCLIVWCGEEGVRVYATGLGHTRSARNVLRQAAAWANRKTRMMVVRRMYEMRFGEAVGDSVSLRQLRGREGKRVQAAYAAASAATGVEWKGRNYDRRNWGRADPVNRALSCANSCLYGLCHAAIVAAGYSPAIGFIHTGKALSFVYDVADLYKTETAIPVAFLVASQAGADWEGRVRRAMRDVFLERRLLERVLPDIQALFHDLPVAEEMGGGDIWDGADEAPGWLWDPELGVVAGGADYAEEGDGRDDPGTCSRKPPGRADPLDAGAAGGRVCGKAESGGPSETLD
jgi:CRISPR-associated protein Cas1